MLKSLCTLLSTKPNPKRQQRVSLGFDVLGIITKKLVRHKNPKVDPPKSKGIKVYEQNTQ